MFKARATSVASASCEEPANNRNEDVSAMKFLKFGVEGFEPPHGGTKNRCLTAWRHPIKSIENSDNANREAKYFAMIPFKS